MTVADATVEAQLLAQVCARPDDDEPRLVYADWLTDRGDARGAFITDQCRLAGLDETHPDWPVLHARTQRALFRHSDAWTEPLRTAGGEHWTSGVFRRGFVEGVLLHGNRMDVAEQLAAVTPLRRVTVHGGTLRRVLEQAAALELIGLSLALGGEEDVSGASRALARFRELELSPSSNDPDCSVLESLLRRASPRSLKIGCFSVEAGVLAPILADCPLEGLGALELQFTRITPAELSAWIGARRTAPPRLSLDFWSRDQSDLAHLLERCPVHALRAGIDSAMLDSPGLARVRRLSPFTNSRDTERLARVPFAGLTHLGLQFSRIGPEGATALARSPHTRHLVSLDLTGNRIGDDGLEAIVDSPHLARLTTLSLKGCELGPRSARALARWPGLRTLTTLDLGNNPGLGEDGLRSLLDAPDLDPVHLVMQRPKHAPRYLFAALAQRFGKALVNHSP